MCNNTTVKAIEWERENKTLKLLDQRLLPTIEKWNTYDSVLGVANAIRNMVVRGAPAIGICAAYGIVIALKNRLKQNDHWMVKVTKDFNLLANSRPTAINLFWALNKMKKCLSSAQDNDNVLEILEKEAIDIHNHDIQSNMIMAKLGMEYIKTINNYKINIITHCNTGALATGGIGTALGVIRSLYINGLINCVYVDETRPWLQGSRLTAWELMKNSIPILLNIDSAAAHIMKTKNISWIIVGADRISSNGDVTNKIGTYQLAVNAKHHGVGFMVVAPTSTIDLSNEQSTSIKIEERDGKELLFFGKTNITINVNVYNPVFDVTPSNLIDIIVTENGIIKNPNKNKIMTLINKNNSSILS